MSLSSTEARQFIAAELGLSEPQGDLPSKALRSQGRLGGRFKAVCRVWSFEVLTTLNPKTLRVHFSTFHILPSLQNLHHEMFSYAGTEQPPQRAHMHACMGGWVGGCVSVYMYTHTHIYIYIYIYLCVCVCMCGCMCICDERAKCAIPDPPTHPHCARVLVGVYICIYIYIYISVCV